MKIRTILQMTFSILSALSVVLAVFLGIFLGFLYALIGVAAVLFFLVLTLFMKNGNPLRREKQDPQVDFMNSEEENEAIRQTLEAADQSEEIEK